MDAEILAAIIAVIGSLIGAAVSLFFSREARKSATRAEEVSKQTEQKRLKATEAGEKILAASADMILIAEKIEAILDQREYDGEVRDLFQEELDKYFREPGGLFNQAAEVMRKQMYSSAIYTTPKIRANVDKLLSPLIKPPYVKLSQWAEFLESMRSTHLEIAEAFRTTYLGDAPLIQE